jgi:hypothetical protein
VLRCPFWALAEPVPARRPEVAPAERGRCTHRYPPLDRRLPTPRRLSRQSASRCVEFLLPTHCRHRCFTGLGPQSSGQRTLAEVIRWVYCPRNSNRLRNSFEFFEPGPFSTISVAPTTAAAVLMLLELRNLPALRLGTVGRSELKISANGEAIVWPVVALHDAWHGAIARAMEE